MNYLYNKKPTLSIRKEIQTVIKGSNLDAQDQN